ncbi:hypothetical protein V8G56_06395 [Gaetbulibacter aquiaggeris]|uniref:Lipocalin-like domain-containing protein n=1 Tax=Gaetbulibacter aquiaggeris TaxID=1735373 RepID=A0ABW7MT73_9FLAO
MKQIIFILLALIILSCNQNHKKDDLLGIWDVVSSTDIETGEVELSEKEFVEFKSDSIYLISDFEVDKVFAWRIEGDSIFLDKDGSVYIKKLTKNELIVEYGFLGKIQLTLKKRK